MVHNKHASDLKHSVCPRNFKRIRMNAARKRRVKHSDYFEMNVSPACPLHFLHSIAGNCRIQNYRNVTNLSRFVHTYIASCINWNSAPLSNLEFRKFCLHFQCHSTIKCCCSHLFPLAVMKFCVDLWRSLMLQTHRWSSSWIESFIFCQTKGKHKVRQETI